jgi:ABC-type transporter Mla maintaining outer membrane lipid asymmetry permease subunit MlaE/ABC-type transporter Mla MlaB component
MNDVLAGDPPTIDVASGQPDTLRLGGAWILAHAPELEDLVAHAGKARSIDATGLQRLDSAGAMLLNRLLCRLKLGRNALRLSPSQQALMAYIDEVNASPPPPKIKELGFIAAIGRLGFSVVDSYKEILALIAFMGLTLRVMFRVATQPKRWRITPTVFHMETVGLDAIRTLGLDPIELLVIPRLVALLVMMPLLGFVGMCAGILGGAVVAWLALGIPLELYWSRLNATIELRHFIVGIVKTPMFATVIALIGCLEGFQTLGTAQSVGERTTSAVVQCISLVIVLDAIAAVFFMEIKL